MVFEANNLHILKSKSKFLGPSFIAREIDKNLTVYITIRKEVLKRPQVSFFFCRNYRSKNLKNILYSSPNLTVASLKQLVMKFGCLKQLLILIVPTALWMQI